MRWMDGKRPQGTRIDNRTRKHLMKESAARNLQSTRLALWLISLMTLMISSLSSRLQVARYMTQMHNTVRIVQLGVVE